MRRREFMCSAGAALAITATGYGSNTKQPTHVSVGSGSQGRIVIVGGGLAGLSAAYELKKAGRQVTVIEARSRPGGRVFTAREPFRDNQYAEMGAEYVDASHTLLRQYCKEFDLKVLTAKLYDAVVLRGKRFAMNDFKNKKVELPYKGTTPGVLFGQERRYAERLLKQIQDPNRFPPELLALDNKSVAEVLLAEGAPQDVISLYTYLNGTEKTARPNQISALSMLRSLHRSSGFNEETDEGRILGGNDQVPKALARKLGKDILYNRPVKQIRHDSDGVAVTFDEDGKQQTMRGARMIIALPFSVLRKLDIQPAFSAAKMRSIESVAYGTVMKLAMQYDQRFWDKKGSLGQRVLTDTSLRRIYHHSIDQPGPSGILLSFTTGTDAAKLGKQSPDQRLATARKVVDNLWTGADRHWVGGFTKYWNEDPYTQGSYSYIGLGQDGYMDRAGVPEGLVHFAGEHTSKYRACMNGAVESGQRAAKEILEVGASAAG